MAPKGNRNPLKLSYGHLLALLIIPSRRLEVSLIGFLGYEGKDDSIILLCEWIVNGKIALGIALGISVTFHAQIDDLHLK